MFHLKSDELVDSAGVSPELSIDLFRKFDSAGVSPELLNERGVS